jgi:hypothetical protein
VGEPWQVAVDDRVVGVDGVQGFVLRGGQSGRLAERAPRGRGVVEADDEAGRRGRRR